MKKFLSAFLILIIVIGILLLLKDVIAQMVFQNRVQSLTGLEAKAKSFRIGLLNTTVALRGLKVMNPPTFRDKVMADFPEIYIDYHLGDLLKGDPHFNEIRMHLQQLTVVRNENNQVNIESLKTLIPPKGEGLAPKIRIDVLDITMDKIIFKDYKSGELQETEFELNYTKRFFNIADAKTLINIIVFEALQRTTIQNIIGVDWQKIQQDITGQIKKQTEGVTQDIKQKATGALEEATEGLKNIFSK